MAASDIALYRTRILPGTLDRPSRRRSPSHWLRELWARQWRLGSGGRPPLPPPEEPASGNPWDDPALWMLMFH